MLCLYQKLTEKKLVYRRKDKINKTNIEIIISDDNELQEEDFQAQNMVQIPQREKSLNIFLIYQTGSKYFWYLETDHKTGEMVILRKMYIHHGCISFSLHHD